MLRIILTTTIKYNVHIYQFSRSHSAYILEDTLACFCLIFNETVVNWSINVLLLFFFQYFRLCLQPHVWAKAFPRRRLHWRWYFRFFEIIIHVGWIHKGIVSVVVFRVNLVKQDRRFLLEFLCKCAQIYPLNLPVVAAWIAWWRQRSIDEQGLWMFRS